MSDNCPSCGVRVDLEHAPYCAAWAGMRNPDPKPVTRRVALERLTPDEVVAAFAALPWPTQLRALADGIERVRKERFECREGEQWPVSDYVAPDLRNMADRWEAWDAADSAAESDREHLVEGLAMAMFRHHYPQEGSWAACPDWLREKYRRDARALLERFDITLKEKP